MDNRIIVDTINEHAEAIETLAKRINKKASAKDIESAKDDILSAIEVFKTEIAKFTQGMVDFFTETLNKNTEANKILFETIRSRIGFTGDMESAKYIGMSVFQEWLTDFIIDYISKNSNLSLVYVRNQVLQLQQFYKFEHGEALHDLEMNHRFIEFSKNLVKYQEEFKFNNQVFCNILSAYLMYISLTENVSIVNLPVYEYYIETIRDKMKGDVEEWL